MNILVLLAGVADNRFPLHGVALAEDGSVVENEPARMVLSPFDEGALELALKLRDKNSKCNVEVLVLGRGGNQSLLRTVAAFKPDRLRQLDLSPCSLWDAKLTAAQLTQLIRTEVGEVDLVLIGREFGDLDEGALPIRLAARLGMPLVSLVQFAQWQQEQLCLIRERDVRQQVFKPEQPVVATITNDRRNKLRHPLMKNVMMAKKLTFECVVASGEKPVMRLRSLTAAKPASRQSQCRMLVGSADDNAKQLLAYIHGEGGASI